MASFFENHISDVAVTVVFGLGYYLFKSFKKTPNDSLTKSQKGLIVTEEPRKTLEEYHEMLRIDTFQKDPFLIIDDIFKNGLTPNIETYNILIEKSLSYSNIIALRQLKDEILDLTGPVNPNEKTLSLLIKSLVEFIKLKITTNEENLENLRKDFDFELDSIVKSIKFKEIEIPVESINFLLENYVNLKRFNEMINFSIENEKKLNLESISILMNSLKQIKILTKEQLLVFNQYIHWIDYQVDEESAFILIQNNIKYQRIEKAESILKLFITKSKEKLENERLLLVLFKFFAKQLKFDKCKNLLDELKSYINPSQELLQMILKTGIKCKKMDKVESIITDFNLNYYNYYEILINGFRLSKNFEKAIRFYEKKEDSNLFTAHSFNNILECCVETSKIEKMHEIYMRRTNKSDFNQITYSILLKGYCSSNMIPEVKNIYNIIRKKEYILDEYLYNICLDVFAKCSDEIYLTLIYNDMKRNSIKIGNNTHSSILKLHYNMNSKKGVELFEEMLKQGVKPDYKIYHYGIKLLLMVGQIDKAICQFRKMQMTNCYIDRELFESMINKCDQKKKDKEAFEFSLCALKLNYRFPEELYNKLVYSMISNEKVKVQEKFDFFNRLNKEIKYRGIRLCNDANEKVERFINSYKVTKPSLYSAGSLYSDPAQSVVQAQVTNSGLNPEKSSKNNFYENKNKKSRKIVDKYEEVEKDDFETDFSNESEYYYTSHKNHKNSSFKESYSYNYRSNPNKRKGAYY